jgi:hypothetical protein
MIERFLKTMPMDVFDPYNMLPIERVVVGLGERR